MTLLEKLLGSTLVSRRGETRTEEALAHKTVVGLYFTASSCHPCQAFTPVLATAYRNMTLAAYKSLPMKEQLDVVLLSLDRSAPAFHDALLQTPFLAVPFHRREVVQDLWKRYEVKKIPTLIFVDANGDEIEREGRRFVENNYTDLRKIWEHLAPPLRAKRSNEMDASSLASGTLEVLNDLLHKRVLTEWRVAHHVRVSEDSDEEVDIVYGFALTTSLQEDRIDRKRKRKASAQQTDAGNDEEQPTWSCFLVLPATYSRAAPTLSIKRYAFPRSTPFARHLPIVFSCNMEASGNHKNVTLT
ncbi:hypothetical protein BBJ28_00020244 [Nothophytophthora sp. Chile5]|nr:hypothetical protein BBJ28_00020244 [Nothophytophthora sp. Chile5]